MKNRKVILIVLLVLMFVWVGYIIITGNSTLSKILWGIAGILYTIAFVLSMRQKKNDKPIV
ncbi:hypothetical protein [Capnocytophaga leadbetteri]|uniref:hypothetical protein n=1 Tax=Capnocytophaga leadbetteri TaxID=327575 RepID=UPI0028EE54C0|nr:hypothetical protein [Capnocytophaga leadbetteri]